MTEPGQFGWALAAGLLAWMLCMTFFGRMLATPQIALSVPQPLEARIVELPAPLPEHVVEQPQRRAPAAPTTKPMPPKSRSAHRTPVTAPPPALARPVDTAPEPPIAKSNPAPEPMPPATPARPNPPAPAAPPGTENMGARVLYQPIPKRPDELRNETVNTMAIARFHIRTDGSTEVELLKATSSPRINQIIFNTLKTWKFFPALREGKPTPSTQDIKVNIEIN